MKGNLTIAVTPLSGKMAHFLPQAVERETQQDANVVARLK